jgi:transcriptional regulator with XRE-family HTH domain
MQTLAQRVRARRVELGLKQQELAGAAGLKQSVVSKIENGKITRTTAIPSLARALRCNPYWLESGEMARQETPPVVGGKEHSGLARELAAHFDDATQGRQNKVRVFIQAVHAINAAVRPGESPHSDEQTAAPGGTPSPEKPP